MKHLFIYLLLFLVNLIFICFPAKAEIGQFLKIEPSARQSALSGAGIAQSDYLNAYYANPAAVTNDSGFTIIFSRHNWLESAKLNYFAAGFNIPFTKGLFGLSYYSSSVENIERRFYNPANPLEILPADGEVSANEYSIGIGYSNVLNSISLQYGLRLNYINFNYAGFSRNTKSMDIGGLYNFSENIRFGGAIKNLFGKASFTGAEKEKLVTEYKAGISLDIKMLNSLWNLDLIKFSDRKLFFQTGLEYKFLKNIFIRAGWQNNNENDMRVSYGFGVRLKKIDIDFAARNMNALGNTWKAGFQYKSSRPKINKVLKETNDNIFEVPEGKPRIIETYTNTDKNQFYSQQKNNAKTELINDLQNDYIFQQAYNNYFPNEFLEPFKFDWEEDKEAILNKWGDLENSSLDRQIFYSDDFINRSIINFLEGNIKIEKIISFNEESQLDDNKSINSIFKKKLYDYFNNIITKDKSGFLKTQFFNTLADDYNFTDFIKHAKLKIQENNGLKIISAELSMNKKHTAARESFFKPLILKYSTEFNVNSDLITAIIKIESNFNPNALGGRSEIGLMQITPQTAGIEVTKKLTGKKILLSDELKDPEVNIMIGCAFINIIQTKYLRGLKDKISDEKFRLLTITAYNAGIGYVYNFKNKFDITKMTDKYFRNELMKNIPETTKNYIKKIEFY